MNEKYYTPSLEEFHVGFKFEYLTNGDEWWKAVIYNSCDFNDVWDSFNEGKYSTDLRVKFLDREDIESFGFKLTEDNWYEHQSHSFNGTTKTKLLFVPFDEPHSNVLRIEDGEDEYTRWCYYDGTIKNKSELKVLLKQLHII